MYLDALVDFIANQPRLFLKLVAIALVYISIIAVIAAYFFREDIKRNWKSIATTPLGILLAPFFDPIPEQTVGQRIMSQFILVMKETADIILAAATLPLKTLLGGMVSYMDSARASVNSVRTQLGAMRTFLAKIALDIFEKIETGAAGVTANAMRVRDQMSRTHALLQLLVNTAEHTMIFMESVVNGPIGAFGKIADKLGIAASVFTFGAFGPMTWKKALNTSALTNGKALCFGPKTPVYLATGKTLEISEVSPGQALFSETGSCTVNAVIHINDPMSFQHEDMTIVHDNPAIIATASHHIARCSCMSSCASTGCRRRKLSKDDSSRPSRLICLITSDHTIPVINTHRGHSDVIFFNDYFGPQALQKHRMEMYWTSTLSLLNSYDYLRRTTGWLYADAGLSRHAVADLENTGADVQTPLDRLVSPLHSTFNPSSAKTLYSGMDDMTFSYLGLTDADLDGEVEIKCHTIDVVQFMTPDNRRVSFGTRTIVFDPRERRWRPILEVVPRSAIEYIGLNEAPLRHFLSDMGYACVPKQLHPYFIAIRDFAELSERSHVHQVEELFKPENQSMHSYS